MNSSTHVPVLYPERELVLRCARVCDDSENSKRIEVLCRNGLDWDSLVEYTTRHRVAPFVYERLTASATSTAPFTHLATLRESASKTARSSLLLLQEMIRVHDLFAARQIPLIPYKGPILAWIAFQNYTLREFTDLDFVLPQKYIPEATTLLRDAGYRETFDLREAHDGRDGSAPGQYLFVRKDRAIQVELHTERTMRYFPVPLDIEDMLRRLLVVEVAGRPIKTFSVEETLVMLCVHGAKHFWERLAWILDIAAIVKSQPVDWDRTIEAAEKMQSTRLLFLGLDLADGMLAAPLPQTLREKIRREPNVIWMSNAVRRQYDEASEIGANVVSRTVFRVRSRDGLAQGVRHLVRLSTVPTEKDRQMVRLPNALSPLYILLRPWRLIREYGLGLRKRT